VLHKNRLFIGLCFIALSISTASAQKAPAFSLAGDKGRVTLSQYKNTVVYLDFWASWCKPCLKSFSFMNSMQKKYGKKGLKIIAVNLDDERSAAAKFLKQQPANFTIAYNPEGDVPNAYNLSVMPTSYLIDRKGNIIFSHKGYKDSQSGSLEKTIIRALNKR
jgi:thiol-disulfide isomerase/thioredoxin